MTRIRVLQRAIKLLQAGFIPYDGRGQAKDKDNKDVSVIHPDAALFNATGAVARAIYELTGDEVRNRIELWTSTMEPFRRKFGPHWTGMYDKFEKMTKEEVIALYQQQLEDWNNL